jgi:hypothetical protein
LQKIKVPETGFETVTTDFVGDWNSSTLDYDDAVDKYVDLGFTFPFNGHTYTQVNISSNGVLYFEDKNNAEYDNTGIPHTDAPRKHEVIVESIYPYWDDMNLGSANDGTHGKIEYDTLGSAPDRHFVVSWEGVSHYSDTTTYTGSYSFQVVLYENGGIRFRYDSNSSSDTDGTSNGGATIGVQEDHNHYDQDSNNTAIDPTEDILYLDCSGTNEPANQASMVINEIMFYQKTSGKENNEEFIEFYVTQGGTLDHLMVSDQDNTPYVFEDYTVATGDYVVLYVSTGGGASAAAPTHSGGVHKYYWGRGPILNNPADDVVLLKPSQSYITSLPKAGEICYQPIDYVAYRTKSGGALDPWPTTSPATSNAFDGTHVDTSGTKKLQSISLTPNGIDNDNASDWENTTSNSAGPITADTNTGSVTSGGTTVEFVCSDGNDNNMPNMHITKTSIVLDDPVNGPVSAGHHPKRIPGATIRYCFTVDNNGSGVADDVTIHDTLDSTGNRDKLTYKHSGKGGLVAGNAACSDDDCKAIADTSGSYDSLTKKVNIAMTTPFTANHHQCAYIDAEIQ